MNYTFLLQKLYSKTADKGIKLGLKNVNQINIALGCPDRHFKSVHVAGTNGKGSVTTKIAKALEFDGFRVGLYTSPHISSFRERIQVNGELINENNVIEWLRKIFFIVENENIPATFFEITTCMALNYFATQKVDFAVIETGLGGRLDATNIITPILSIITSISFDHTDILGNSLEDIALEKSGIIKPHVPIILGPRVPHALLEKKAALSKSPCFIVKGVYDCFDDENSAIAEKALEVLKVSPEAIKSGLTILPPCRLQIYPSSILNKSKVNPLPSYIVLDVAHNPDGLKHLFIALKKKLNPKKIRVLCSLSKNKDLQSCLQIIVEHADIIEISQAPTPRAAAVEEIKCIIDFLALPLPPINFNPCLEESIKKALAEACLHSEVLVICGTFFIMSCARAILGIEDPQDPIPLGESFLKKM